MRKQIRFSNPELKNRRRKLRTDSTQAEKILWNFVRRKNLGYKFKRQFSIDNYVLDFFCPDMNLGVELVGEIHNLPEKIIYDKYRTRYLLNFGIKILFFTNEEVVISPTNVVNQIKQNFNPSPTLRRG